MVFGLQTQPKSWLTGYTFWVNHYLEIVFSKISVVNPPPPLKGMYALLCSLKLGDGSTRVWWGGGIKSYLSTIKCYLSRRIHQFDFIKTFSSSRIYQDLFINSFLLSRIYQVDFIKGGVIRFKGMNALLCSLKLGDESTRVWS